MFELANGGVIVLYAVSAVVPLPITGPEDNGCKVLVVGGEAYLPTEEAMRLIEALKKIHGGALESLGAMTNAPQEVG